MKLTCHEKLDVDIEKAYKLAHWFFIVMVLDKKGFYCRDEGDELRGVSSIFLFSYYQR